MSMDAFRPRRRRQPIWRPHVRVGGRVAAVLAALVAAIAVATMAAPGDADALSWKVVCQIGVGNQTGSISGLRPFGGFLPEITPNPVDEAKWEVYALPGNGIPLGPSPAHPVGGAVFETLGLPVTWGCSIHPAFKRGNDVFKCDVYAPSSGPNIFQCSPVAEDHRQRRHQGCR
jgi:hypothetical protein